MIRAKYTRKTSLLMAKVSDVPKMVGFKEMMGYINTAPEKQQKGAKGYAK